MRYTHYVLVALALLLSACDRAPSEPVSDAQAAPTRSFSMHASPRPVPDLVFQNAQGENVKLSAHRGKVVLLNVWATWCPPCREEMPTLDRLQAELGGPDFEVLALSVDHKGMQVVQKFYGDIGIKHLRPWVDPSPQTLDSLDVLGLPVTLLLDRNGRELGRLLGTAEWDSPEMVQFLREIIGRERQQTVRLDADHGGR
ncbi:MAG TPA: TlpA disulfide reductase family protein [Burkholderiales bacterium]